VAAGAHAQSTRNATAYPTKPIRLLVPFTPGGSQDVIARLFGQLVGDAVGQQVVIDNRAGAGGLIAAAETAHANPDAYTLLLSGGAQIAIAPALNAKLAYDPVKDFIHVMHLVDLPLVLIINPALPVANLKDFIAYARANRGKVNTASTGRGTYTHLTIELFNSITGAELAHIPYKGAAPAMNDLMGRQIQAMFTTVPSAQPYTSTAGSPAPAVRRLSDAFGQALQAPVLRERLAVLGAEPVGDTSEKFTRMVRADIDRWAKIIKSAGITID
ncbi:MAG: tripartite tricarboxylate transporter substrate binding protein, partial [Betaproteobacteria bacterium]|nr:tripartite tricarboxylate transporter substrate binding protein [Betaproteobacteria bacterium]